jgi:hypothetical protein
MVKKEMITLFQTQLPRYLCRFVAAAPGESEWAAVEAVTLADTVTFEPYEENTQVQSCWDADGLYIRFTCQDRHVAATLLGRDEPLYEEDVVEVFIDESGDGSRYLEFEVNPNNALFDARIANDLNGTIQIDSDWDAQGIRTSVTPGQGRDLFVYDIFIPHVNFGRPPTPGTEWRVNLYRIDEDRQGIRHYLAWSPTGRLNFHLPAFFGRWTFMN